MNNNDKSPNSSTTNENQQNSEKIHQTIYPPTSVAYCFSSDLKRKRKLSSDSLDTLDTLDDDDDEVLTKLANVSHRKQRATNRPLIVNNFKSYINNNHCLNDIDDLPSESDVSTGMVLIPINGTALQPLHHKPSNISICYKCNKCNKMFSDESSLKLHQDAPVDCLLSQTPSSLTQQRQSNVDNIESEELEKLLFSTTASTTTTPHASSNMDPLELGKEDKNIRSSSTSESAVESTSSTAMKKSIKSVKRRVFICTECGIQFHLQSDLNRHMLQVHESVKPYQCSMCTMKFYELSSKNRHEKEHSGEKPFRCYICSFEFTRASNLRTHLLKLHPAEVGKLVHIGKSEDNKLKFEFNLDAISAFKEQARMIQRNQISSGDSPSANHECSSSTSPLPSSSSNLSGVASNNTIIYIKDPKNKSADIQHMVIYVDGKPIFVQNPKIIETSAKESNKVIAYRAKTDPIVSVENNVIVTTSKPVTKIPYLLAAAAAAASSNHRKQHGQKSQATSTATVSDNHNQACAINDPGQLVYHTSSNYVKSTPIIIQQQTTIANLPSKSFNREIRHDQEYMQLVSMFKQKNEKLSFNPLLNKGC